MDIIQCKNCRYYLTLEEAKKDPMFENYPFDAAEKIGKDGLCINTDKWIFNDDFCSYAKNKED